MTGKQGKAGATKSMVSLAIFGFPGPRSLDPGDRERLGLTFKFPKFQGNVVQRQDIANKCQNVSQSSSLRENRLTRHHRLLSCDNLLEEGYVVGVTPFELFQNT